jgi:hypothetical protein
MARRPGSGRRARAAAEVPEGQPQRARWWIGKPRVFANVMAPRLGRIARSCALHSQDKARSAAPCSGGDSPRAVFSTNAQLHSACVNNVTRSHCLSSDSTVPPSTITLRW